MECQPRGLNAAHLDFSVWLWAFFLMAIQLISTPWIIHVQRIHQLICISDIIWIELISYHITHIIISYHILTCFISFPIIILVSSYLKTPKKWENLPISSFPGRRRTRWWPTLYPTHARDLGPGIKAWQVWKMLLTTWTEAASVGSRVDLCCDSQSDMGTLLMGFAGPIQVSQCL